MHVFPKYSFAKPFDFESHNGSMALRITREVKASGGRAFFVGGSVRDAVMGKQSDDIDIEVYGIESEMLEKLLQQITMISCVGKSFGVFIVKGYSIDVALPRTESKSGIGHKGFSVQGDHMLSIEDAAKRRDFTINAMLWDPIADELHDPFNGLEDLRLGILRHCSPQFSEDPLRVLRAMQFAARFEMTVASETILLCRGISIENLPKERLFEEWKKLIILGKKPSLGLQFLSDCRWIDYFPEVRALQGCPQDAHWHPEGDVFTHTALALDAFAKARIHDEREDFVVGLAVLCHDFGKPLCTYTDEEGRIRSPNHENLGEIPARTFLKRITEEKALTEDVVKLVLHHMKPSAFFRNKAGDTAIRRLSTAIERIDRLIRVDAADHQGRLNANPDMPEHSRWLLERANALSVAQEKPKPILLGRHLINQFNMKPGPEFSRILDTVYEQQIEGKIVNLDEALAFAKTMILQ